MYKFLKIFEDIEEKAAEQIIKDALIELEHEKVIPPSLISLIDVAIPVVMAVVDDVVGISASEK